jgi:hypothetical protein
MSAAPGLRPKAGLHRVPVYRRYHIATAETRDLKPLPHRFLVKVRRLRLAKLLLTEVVRYWGRWRVVLNRPCIYGVFSGPMGGFWPRPRHCVGCLRCTIQHPDVVRILHNPALASWSDDYLTGEQVVTIFSEAAAGRVPVKGQGYRGAFGGPGWDGMWTDMSEIVRPTRDGIHGRESISTAVDLGAKPTHLQLDAEGRLVGRLPPLLSLEIPMLFDLPPAALDAPAIAAIWARAAEELATLALLPVERMRRLGLFRPAVVPVGTGAELTALAGLGRTPRMVEILGWDPAAFAAVAAALPEAVVAVRLGFEAGWQERLDAACRAGVPVVHLEADYHGRGAGDAEGHRPFLLELLIEAHRQLVASGLRDRVTLVGSGGIVAAEHVPKALIAGLDAVALDLPLALALQCRPTAPLLRRGEARLKPPRGLTEDWGVQRLKNLAAAWRDQLLEILGAMGIREVRRLRGELGRAMFQRDLEREAFGDIEGFPAEGG